MNRLLALTLHRPWPWAVVELGKRIENRPRGLRQMLGQVVALHAGETLDWFDRDRIVQIAAPTEEQLARFDAIPARSIFALVRLARVHDGEKTIGDPLQRRWFFGPKGIELEDLVAIEPVKCDGRRGFWPVPDQVAREVLRRVAAARGGNELLARRKVA